MGLGNEREFQKCVSVMNDHLLALKLFVRVARQGNFSAAGRDLNLPQPTVSRTISSLEKNMGVALLTRTTRAVSLTEAGADFLARLEPILDALEDAEQAARGSDDYRGVLRVGVSSSFAIRGVVPRLQPFLDRHPGLKVELILDDQRQDFVTDGVDVGLRFGALTDSTAVAKRICSSPRVLAASPEYLKRAGVPLIPADLTHHAVIAGPSRIGQSWSFQKAGKTTSVRVVGQLLVTVNEVSIAAAVAGLGIVSMSLGGCRKEIETGELIRLLPDWDMGLIDLHAVFAAGRAAKPSARAFAEFLAEAFRGSEDD